MIGKRKVLKAGVLAGLAGAFSGLAGAWPGRLRAAPVAGRARPSGPQWPSAADWGDLRARLTGELEAVETPAGGIVARAKGEVSPASTRDLANPFFIQEFSGGTQAAGWSDGWISSPSVHAAIPENAEDVAIAVRFARERNLRLVIKGGGHSYLGQSNAPDSLMIWTRKLDALKWHDGFVPQGCAGTIAPLPAVSVGAGAKFIDLYDFVTTQRGRYVQGGGCTTVGVGGHLQTGGFGSFSKYGGLTAAGLLEAEIVTADGTIRTVNACRDAELFWALKGGGAGWGVTTRLTLATHPLPATFGAVNRTFRAASDSAYRRLVEAFLAFSRDALVNPHWGEQVTFSSGNVLDVRMVFQGLTETEAMTVWEPFDARVGEWRGEVSETAGSRLVVMPARHWWDFEYRKKHFPKSIRVDDRPGAPPGRFWWQGNTDEVGIFIADYESAWLPETLLSGKNVGSLARALFDASRHYPVTLHYNKGLAGATAERIREARETPIHAAALDAFALAIVAGGQPKVYPGIAGLGPKEDAARAEAARIRAAFGIVRSMAPESGSYSSEMSFHEANWREAAWGEHYPRLLDVKRKYDPDGLFTGHHQVGSEFWTADGFTRVPN